MHFTIVKDGIEYQISHLTNTTYELDGKKYGPESYLIRGPKDEHSRAMTVEEYRKFEKEADR